MKYDLTVIGTGMGALTVAGIAAKYYNKRVLMLEQHFKPGGYTHVFKRKQKYQWDVGIHYIGDLAPGSSLRGLFDSLTSGKLDWVKMPDDFEVFHYPWGSFRVPSSPEEYEARLAQLFPDEKTAIQQYFNDVKKGSQWFSRNMTLKGKPAFFDQASSIYAFSNGVTLDSRTSEYMDAQFKSPRLKSLLASQWGDHGLPPAQSSILMHCLIVHHYLNGGYYPKGGSQHIANSIIDEVKKAGGDVKLNQKVVRLDISDDLVRGVYAIDPRKANSEETYYEISELVSNAGAVNNYFKLLPDDIGSDQRAAIKEVSKDAPITTNVTLYIGLKDSPESLGVKGENYWIFGDEDHDAAFAQRSEWIEDNSKPAEFAYLSFPSLKSGESEIAHTAEVISFTDYSLFEKWEKQPWKKKDAEYQSLKESIAQKLLTLIDKVHPGFNNLVDFYELSTPLSNTFFSNHPRGAIYGVPTTPARFHSVSGSFTKVKTPIENFYQTGADVNSPGVAGALMGGVMTSATLFENSSVMKIFKKLSQK